MLIATIVTSAFLQATLAPVSYASQEPTAVLHALNHVVPALPPIGYTKFCWKYPSDCARREIDFRQHDINLTPALRAELNNINSRVNRAIAPSHTNGAVINDDWVVAPLIGDCTDYAVTKRHELLAHGWPSRTLLLSEVVVPSGEHHLILVVHTSNADLVLDNLNDNILSVATASRRYRWVRIELPQNPRLWGSLIEPIKVPKNMAMNAPPSKLMASTLGQESQRNSSTSEYDVRLGSNVRLLAVEGTLNFWRISPWRPPSNKEPTVSERFAGFEQRSQIRERFGGLDQRSHISEHAQHYNTGDEGRAAIDGETDNAAAALLESSVEGAPLQAEEQDLARTWLTYLENSDNSFLNSSLVPALDRYDAAEIYLRPN